MRLIIIAVLFACACGAAAPPQRKVAVLGVERHSGAQDPSFEKWLERHVDAHFEVVTSAPPEDGLEEIDEESVRAVAARLGVDAVVYGELSKKKRGKMRLTVRVHDGRTGQLIETHEVAIKGGKAVVKQEKRFARELLALLPPPSKATKVAKAKRSKVNKKKKRAAEPAEDNESTDEPTEASEPTDEPVLVAADDDDDSNDRSTLRRDEPDDDDDDDDATAAAFVPAKNLKPVKLNDEGQAADEEMPTLFVKK